MWQTLRKKTEKQTADRALPGRATPSFNVPTKHFVNGNRIQPPFPAGLEKAMVGMGCFWGAERKFWETPGVYATAVGYAAGLTPKLCMLTVHGIGFQQPPQPGLPGYADVLHVNLATVLGSKLGNDPKRQPEANGPVYVMSAKPGTHNTEWGLSRLGTWRDGGLDITGMP